MNYGNASRVMLLTKKLHDNPQGGRELLCRLNYSLLRDIFRERLVLFELETHSVSGGRNILNTFAGYIDGLNPQTIDSAMAIMESQKIGKVFVDGSNLGEFVAALKRSQPSVEVVTFFHNVESRFFLGLLREKFSIRALAVLTVNFLAERKAVRYSDRIVCLNERDSRLLQRVYGRAATHVSPMALEDRYTGADTRDARMPDEKYALFVGGTFYANRAGIEWFVKNVASRIRIKTCIVGRGFEKYRDRLEVEGRVQVVGGVDDLEGWYRNAHFVIAPIFDGSGMKTKVAEALMYGKKIIGTPEAFSGYEDIADRAGRVCITANEFVVAIEAEDNSVSAPFDEELRALYERNYSYTAARSRLAGILNSVE